MKKDDLQPLAESLADILHTPVRFCNPVEADPGDGTDFRVEVDGEDWLLRVDAVFLSPREKALIRLLLDQWKRGRDKAGLPEEDPFRTLSRWVLRVEDGEQDVVPPPAVEQLSWRGRVPFLVLHTGAFSEREGELPLLLQSYFDNQGWVIPIHPGELLVLAPGSMLAEENEADEYALEDAAYGLADVVTSEAGEDVTVVVHPPLESAFDLPAALKELRDTCRIGRLYHPDRSIHAPWHLLVERLIESVQEQQARRFLEDLSEVPFWKDPELRKTLHVFLEQNLNVSEAARQLYIHRNTLIYRLDRLKQETGLDVRRLEDAWKVKLALLLQQRWEV